VRQVTPQNDPAPSRWSYRYQRLMLTPSFRKLLRIGLPFCITFGIAITYLSDRQVQEKIWLALSDIRHQIETRPEFMVDLLAVEGASIAVAEEIRETFPYALPASSFDMELDDVRKLIEEMPPVERAAVRLRQGGVMEVIVTERTPVALIRSREGLEVVDLEGVVIDVVQNRSDRPKLPILTGEGAERHVAEALAIRQSAGPLHDRMRGLVRMGERRWDVVLDRDQRILLPEKNPVRALERVIVLNDAQDMLERDIAAVDMRLASRPTLRMRERAVDAWWRVRNLSLGANEQ